MIITLMKVELIWIAKSQLQDYAGVGVCSYCIVLAIRPPRGFLSAQVAGVRRAQNGSLGTFSDNQCKWMRIPNECLLNFYPSPQWLLAWRLI